MKTKYNGHPKNVCNSNIISLATEPIERNGYVYGDNFNGVIKPVIKILSIPVTIVTLGLFSFVINGLMVLLCAKIIGDQHFHVDGFWAAVLFSIILSVVNWVISKMFDPDKK